VAAADDDALVVVVPALRRRGEPWRPRGAVTPPRRALLARGRAAAAADIIRPAEAVAIVYWCVIWRLGKWMNAKERIYFGERCATTR
jgi:hypothetical protein